jgi:hypothetical protein
LAASSGSGVVATTQIKSSSRVMLQAIGVPAYGNTNLGVSAVVSTIASGTSFTVRLSRCQTAGTLATASGRVAWQILNLT